MQEIFVQLPDSTQQLAVHYPKESKQEQSVATVEINTTRQAILQSLYDYHHLTAEQIVRDNDWRPGYLRDIQNHLKLMSDGKAEKRFVEKLLPNKQIRFGSAPYVYTLGRAGRSHLRKDGFDLSGWKDEVLRGIPLAHRLAVNEMLLRARLLEKLYTGIYLRESLHESYWNANPLKIVVPTAKGGEKTVSISPDLLLHFEIETPHKQYRFLPEIYLSRQWPKDWREIVRLTASVWTHTLTDLKQTS